MNFIGHALLACEGNDSFLFGNLIADGIKGSELGYLGAELEAGVRWHRRVDAVIDQHPRVLALMKQMPHRRVAGIALDIVWDHFLSRYELTEALADRCYRLLSARPLPEKLNGMLTHLVEGRWLERYADYGFTLSAISGVGHRLRGENLLRALIPWLETHYDELQVSYQRLWPDIQQTLTYHP
ncbi:Acyl carrier protein phosphodiesterase [Halomonadaceae bacterium LMG 33818]|uniref:acyl carrier protein phosphodiesterase n=1 Tax=Cernens ardua TaxID=3402176 RepID=UPI003EDC5692